MQFKQGAHVYTADGKDVGVIDRVVLDPKTDEITHVVVRKGWLFTEDKVAPITLIDPAVQDQVRLRRGVENLDDLPPFEETHFVTPSETGEGAYPGEDATPLYWYPPVGEAWSGYYTGYFVNPTWYPVQTEQHIPKGTVGLKEGADVVSVDGERVGRVARIFTNAKLNRATHILISEGWLFKEKRLIPADWISTVEEDEIHLAVNARTLERLPEYQPEAA